MHAFKRFVISIVLMAASAVHAAPGPPVWETAVRKADQAYWDAYNRRDPDTMNSFLTEDVEFYHDRGGTLIGKRELGKVNSGMKTNKARLRRTLVPGSLHVYPMRRDETIYGAVVTGEHDFFALETGKADQLLGRALFTHLMVLKDGQWKIKRILSYSHIDVE